VLAMHKNDFRVLQLAIVILVFLWHGRFGPIMLWKAGFRNDEMTLRALFWGGHILQRRYRGGWCGTSTIRPASEEL
jgi:hypothetical protein